MEGVGVKVGEGIYSKRVYCQETTYWIPNFVSLAYDQ